MSNHPAAAYITFALGLLVSEGSLLYLVLLLTSAVCYALWRYRKDRAHLLPVRPRVQGSSWWIVERDGTVSTSDTDLSTGYPTGYATGRSIWAFYARGTPEAVAMRSAIEQRTPWHGLTEGKTGPAIAPPQTRRYLTHYHPLPDGTVYCEAVDVTDLVTARERAEAIASTERENAKRLQMVAQAGFDDLLSRHSAAHADQ